MADSDAKGATPPKPEDDREPSGEDSSPQPEDGSTADAAQDRMARFKALQARAKTSLDKNRKEVYAERKRQAMDPHEITLLQRKKADAELKLEKATIAEEGGDFERKRAWDWTIEENEKWDKRLDKKKKHAEDVAFHDYRQNARKVYKRQLRGVETDLESYEKERAKVAKEGQIYETETGELIAVDKNGEFYADGTSTAFVDNKPPRAAVDRLVADLKKADQVRIKRQKKGDDDDITYINDKNKQFNQKLARYYNKYTSEIRDSFERGTMI
ncbi:pre-mRNA-splicing factor syf2 [Drechslerella stenobrocha 248]|uniref:Pre-mRNA-splicing factor SYF2 n=1 Tax=Drechslerella stenobrocha 248 TaxID=1043628 RepID=W7HU73_9PEZI|nr:pre-mRNA-splicing factor syf2 [Drechslerella stenobrocha 248]